MEDFNKSFSKIIKRKVISQKTSESRWMGSESPEMTRKRYRSAADCAMRKEKDINYVACRRNEPYYCPVPPRDSFNRKKMHYSQPVLSLAPNA